MHISTENTKMGDVHSVSLSPDYCPEWLPCKKKCYACRLQKLRPILHYYWDMNYREVVFGNLYVFFKSLSLWLTMMEPKLFRWHVAGEIPSQDYLNMIVDTAIKHPAIRFMIFTKAWIRAIGFRFPDNCPPNLSIIWSMWPGQPVPVFKPHYVRYAWVRTKEETRIPKNAINCKGGCRSCMKCWNLAKLGRDVAFPAH